jgi:hypothetical protein
MDAQSPNKACVICGGESSILISTARLRRWMKVRSGFPAVRSQKMLFFVVATADSDSNSNALELSYLYRHMDTSV